MKYRELGTTGMNISQITLGTWGMGDVGWDHYDESTRIDAIRTAAQCGVNLIDTAPAYNNGASERLVGRALAQLGIRNELYISTKCGNVFVDGKVYRRDGSAAMIRQQCEESLVNLQTDHIDVMLIHWPDPDTPFEETLGALNELKKEGKLTKTILYTLNPCANEMIATMLGNFQDGSCPGKIQFGSGWWFNDQLDGMTRQMNALSVLGLLSRFVGMLTDSRSFVSYPRHEYFRRLLCNLLGNDVEKGLLPDDKENLYRMVEDISYYNAKNYFNF